MCDEIAIVGVGCRFPGADNLEEFWRVLVESENHVREVDNERWNFYDYYDPDIHAEGKTAVNRAGLLKNIEEWDNEFFGVSDNEAKVVDPQQRLVLDCCHMAMEDAGITRKQLDGSQTSVYVGAMNDDFNARKRIYTAADSAYSVTGIFRSILSARVSYTFNLKGPCMVVDTACSSSLVAIHLACQSLTTDESDMAFAGGVSVLLDPSPFVPLSKARMLSPTGQCQTFSSDANGYARGEGCGMVILQRLEDALRDGNNIWGVIKTGTNQDGRVVTPMTAPSGVQQLELLHRVYRRNERDKNDVQVIEAHGTGTPKGDPTEVNALGEFFKDTETAKRDKIFIGSVKTNIGHLESAAGVAGLIKVILMMRNETIVPSLMYSEEKRNPKLDFMNLNFIVPTESMKWCTNNNQSRVACVNSFGFGGSNAHLLIKQWLNKPKVNDTNIPVGFGENKLFVISSNDEEGLEKNLLQFKEDLKSTSEGLNEITITSLCRRDHFKYRAAIVASSKDELHKLCLTKMKGIPQQRPHAELQFVYVFCGVGTAWNGMCYELLQIKVFKTAVVSVDNKLKEYTGWSMIEKWTNKEDVSDPFVSHLSIFVCQVGLTAVWKAVGIKPDVVIGQSVGEVAACLASGVIDEDTAVKIIYHRSMVLNQCKSGGMMVVRNKDVTTIAKMCQEMGNINVAVYISPVACTVSGEKSAIERLEKALKEHPHVRMKKLHVACGYHSPMVKEAGENLETFLVDRFDEGKVKPDMSMISTVYGKELDQGDYRKATYWMENVTKPVGFHDAILQSVHGEKYTIFIEIGPSPVLQAHSEDIFGDYTKHQVVPSVMKEKENTTLLQALGIAYELGSELDFHALFEPYLQTRPSLLPRYVFNKKYFPLPKEYEINSTNTMNTSHKYIVFKGGPNLEENIEIRITPATTPYAYQHLVRDIGIVPGAIYADVGFEIGRHFLHAEVQSLSVTLDLLKAVPVIENEAVSMNMSLNKTTVENAKHCSFRIYHNGESVCKGTVYKENTASSKTNYVDLELLNIELHEKVSSNDTYISLQEAGFRYGPQLKCIGDGVKHNTKSLLDVVVTDEVIKDLGKCHLHPCILDAMLQTSVVFTLQHDPSMEKMQYIPVGMDRVNITKNLKTISHNSQLKVLTDKVCDTSLENMKKQHFNIYLIDGSCGLIMVEIRNFVMYAANRQMKSCDDLRFTLSWKPATDVYRSSYTANQDETVLLINANENLSNFFKKSVFSVDYSDFNDQLSEENKEELNEKLRNCSAVVVSFTSDIQCLDDGQLVYNNVLKNVQFLQIIIVHFMKQEMYSPEVFLLTVGVHAEHYTGKYAKDTSLVGSEIWGFFRNLQAEFVYNKLNLIDIAALSDACLETFLAVMNESRKNQQPNGREFMISGRDVYEIHVNATSKRTKMPMLRCDDGYYSSKHSNEQEVQVVDNLQGNLTSPHSSEGQKSISEKRLCKLKVSQDNLFDRMGTYIVVGGLTGVGWMIVELMAEMGAGIIVTFGRRACSSEMEEQIKEIENFHQCRIIHYKVNVTEASEVDRTIKNITERFTDHTIRGIFQGAGVIRGAKVEKLTNDQIEDVLKPKILGTVNLHNATKHLQLDYFGLLSSISSIFGSVGHTTYGAANSFLDAFADNRRQNGFNVQSINWGAISSGMAAVETVARDLEIRGHIHLKREEFRSCFIHCLMMNESNVIYANLDHDKMLKIATAADYFFISKKFDFLWENKLTLSADGNRAACAKFGNALISGKTELEQVKFVEDSLKDICSAATAQKIENDDINEPFIAMGIDSMATITIVSLIQSKFGVTLKSEMMLEPTSSIRTLTTIIVADLKNQA